MAEGQFVEQHTFTGTVPSGNRRICPFMSLPATNNYVYCLGNKCQLWDENAPGPDDDGNCGANSLDRHNLERHLHQYHEHPILHACNEVPFTENCGNVPFMSQISAIKVPYASTLLNEYMNREDLDFDDYTYGVHFHIDNSDSNLPFTLSQFQNTSGFITHKYSSKIKWQHYLNWKDGDDDDNFYQPWADITITGDNPAELTVGDTYTDAGATANDDEDGDITADITSTTNVNTSFAGTYRVVYTVTNSKNVTVKKERTVIVSEA